MATSADLAGRMLAAAENDELMAKSVLPVPGVTDAGVGFHCQQAVEKAIKAVLAAKEIEFPFTHNLRALRELSTKSAIELPSVLDGVEALTPFALAERYGAEEPLTLDRDQALKWATEAIAWARTAIDVAGAEAEQSAQPDPKQSQPDPD